MHKLFSESRFLLTLRVWAPQMESGGDQQGLGLLSESCILKVLSELGLPVLRAVEKMRWAGHGAAGLFHQPWYCMELLWDFRLSQPFGHSSCLLWEAPFAVTDTWSLALWKIWNCNLGSSCHIGVTTDLGQTQTTECWGHYQPPEQSSLQAISCFNYCKLPWSSVLVQNQTMQLFKNCFFFFFFLVLPTFPNDSVWDSGALWREESCRN